MSRSLFALAAALHLSVAAIPAPAFAWGTTAHTAINRAAIASIPDDGPVFLKDHIDFIGGLASLPDIWRSSSEPFSKIEEDPNHGWFSEQFTFMKTKPRSRYEFVIALLNQQRTVADPASDDALRTNIRWTGTMPYAIVEAYGRLVAGMRWHRRLADEGKDTRFIDQALAYDVVRIGHYIGDGAQPLHASIHSDGWRGDNPKGYTTDRTIHSRFESQFVDMIGLTEQQVTANVAPVARQGGDLFDTVLAFLDDSAENMEGVYQLDKQAAFAASDSKAARDLVYARTGAGASMLRDLVTRAWAESVNPPVRPATDPLDPKNPSYNPETGSAPAK
ncbi:MAG: nuclease [Blastomonas fulva]|uniref:nuclease n=1 Tax=Blastomonas fulva TaxID=1550728 RepID=UPI0024E24003|nr:nuclease [Blastomonas fulva]MDK2758106.1 nuclease [Blastomonas fulva]